MHFLPFFYCSLLLQKKLHKFELACLANLCPETAEEAKALIPRLVITLSLYNPTQQAKNRKIRVVVVFPSSGSTTGLVWLCVILVV